LKPFSEAIKSGAMSIMVSRSSINGKKISADKYLMTDLLKGELGFKGFLVSDWGAINQIPGDYYQDIVISINAGMDMVMLPSDYDSFIDKISKAIDNGDIAEERIDDAVRRILRAKSSLGLFDKASVSSGWLGKVGSNEHREVARQAVRESLVLLKNENDALPIHEQKKILIVGRAADDIGMQAGGWTIEWQGGHGDTTPGTSILAAFKNEFVNSKIIYDPMAMGTLPVKADVGVVIVGEQPYAEGKGDRESLSLSPEDLKRIQTVKKNSRKTVLIIIAGRPLIIQDAIKDIDAVVMAWLPGTEGSGITDVLSGKNNFTGKLPLDWPRTMEQVRKRETKNSLFGFGYGLHYNQTE
jgi:beta-glucosidase